MLNKAKSIFRLHPHTHQGVPIGIWRQFTEMQRWIVEDFRYHGQIKDNNPVLLAKPSDRFIGMGCQFVGFDDENLLYLKGSWQILVIVSPFGNRTYIDLRNFEKIDRPTP